MGHKLNVKCKGMRLEGGKRGHTHDREFPMSMRQKMKKKLLSFTDFKTGSEGNKDAPLIRANVHKSYF